MPDIETVYISTQHYGDKALRIAEHAIAMLEAGQITPETFKQAQEYVKTFYSF